MNEFSQSVREVYTKPKGKGKGNRSNIPGNIWFPVNERKLPQSRGATKTIDPDLIIAGRTTANDFIILPSNKSHKKKRKHR